MLLQFVLNRFLFVCLFLATQHIESKFVPSAVEAWSLNHQTLQGDPQTAFLSLKDILLSQ